MLNQPCTKTGSRQGRVAKRREIRLARSLAADGRLCVMDTTSCSPAWQLATMQELSKESGWSHRKVAGCNLQLANASGQPLATCVRLLANVTIPHGGKCHCGHPKEDHGHQGIRQRTLQEGDDNQRGDIREAVMQWALDAIGNNVPGSACGPSAIGQHSAASAEAALTTP